MWKVSFSQTRCFGDLTSWLGWVASSNHELTAWLAWDFCPVVQQLACLFNFWHAWHMCNFWRLASRELPARSNRESLLLCTILSISSHSHTLPVHDSHLNTGLLITKIQANLARNKANKMVDKIQPYNYLY